MHLKTKIIYLLSFILLCNFILSISFSIASNQSTVYVWSNDSQNIVETNAVEQQENSRKFFKYYIWKHCFNGSKNWSNFV